jgi:hypothetical protein
VEEADRLYDLPLESFTQARNELAAELKQAGRADDAERVRALRKPSVAAWAVNQLARRQRSELDGFLHAAARLRQALLGESDVREATRAEREALERLVRLAGEYAAEAQLLRVRQTLETAAADEAAAETVRAGRLERELEPVGFGSLVVGPAPAARRRRGPDPALKQAVAEARERVTELRRQARAAEDEARRRHAEWQRAKEAADSAAEQLADAEQALADAEARLGEG